MKNSNKKSNKPPDRINLGCGRRKLEGWCNIDSREEVEPDLVLDVAEGLPFEDNSIKEVRAYDFLEHIPADKAVFVIEEIWRVLESGGRLEHFTPSTDGRGAFQDPMHRSFWNINSWFYYMLDEYRNLYGIKAKFRGENHDVVTDKQQRVIHVRGVLHAVKG